MRKNSGALLVAVGFLMRLGSVAYQYRYHLNPAADHWRFGWEMGRVARAIYEGHGFASPMYQPSGPTAWMAPVYPLLIATGFKLFGIYTAAAAWFILSLNALFGALTALPIRATARRIFHNDRLANISAWVWTCLPYSIYVAGERIWENTLTTLLAACLIWLTYVVEEEGTYRLWLLWAALWGLAALTSPALLTPLPALGLWIAYASATGSRAPAAGSAAIPSPSATDASAISAMRQHRAHRPWFLQATASALLFFALLAPWTLRNYAQFHRFIPVRDNFWLEVHVGNNGDTRHPCPDAVHPSNSARERQQWTTLGELAYMDAKKVESKQWIRQHPRDFLILSARRALFVWTAFWSTSPYYLDAEPMEYPATAYFSIITLLAAAGFIRARRNGFGPLLCPMLWFLLIFPAPYYVTLPSYDYRHAMEPILIIMATYACATFARRRTRGRSGIHRRVPGCEP